MIEELEMYKYYVNESESTSDPFITYDDMEDAVYWIWANRESYKSLYLMLGKESDNAEDIITDSIYVGKLEYDANVSIYYWFNVSSENVSGFPVDSPEDIMEMLKINKYVGEPDEDDERVYSGIADKNAVKLNTDYDLAIDTDNKVTPFYPIGNDKF